MRSLFNPLRCDLYNFEDNIFVHHEFIPDPSFRIISTAVSNSCILFKAHETYGEFSTINLVDVKHIRHRNNIMLMVKKYVNLVTPKFVAYSMLFGTSGLAKEFYDVISKHVHHPLQIIQWQHQAAAANVPSQPENAAAAEEGVQENNDEVEMNQLDMEEGPESVVNHGDNNNSHVSSLENFNDDADQD